MMRFSPMSFLAGLAVAGFIPLVARTARPLAVQATATALDAIEQAQRVFAERREALDDLLAEARMQREAAIASSSPVSGNGSEPQRKRARRGEPAKSLSETRP
jgi:hypothetical protein